MLWMGLLNKGIRSSRFVIESRNESNSGGETIAVVGGGDVGDVVVVVVE